MILLESIVSIFTKFSVLEDRWEDKQYDLCFLIAQRKLLILGLNRLNWPNQLHSLHRHSETD